MNMKLLIKSQCVVGILVAVVFLFVVDTLAESTTPVTWMNVSGASNDDFYWGVATNWHDAAGNSLDVAPTNAADHFAVTLTALPNNRNLLHKIISTKFTGNFDAVLSNGAVDPSIVSIAGDERYTVRHTDMSAGIVKYGARLHDRTFTVENPNDFTGFWEMQEPYSQILVSGEATADFVPTLWNLGLAYRARINVPQGGTARVGATYDTGVLVKTGNGDLRVGATAGAENTLLIESGSVTLEGSEEFMIEELLSRASLHLDASATNSLVRSIDGASVYVTRWNDCRGNGKFAEPSAQGFNHGSYYISQANAPEFVEGVSKTGLPMIDFGEIGIDNRVMQFAEESVTEIFYVAQYTAEPASNPVLQGDPLVFYMNSRRQLNESNASLSLLAGDISLNCRKIQPSYSPTSEEAFKPFVYSFSGTEPVKLKMMASDRGEIARTGGMRIGEIVLFAGKLTREERVRISRYLNAKWRIGSVGNADFGYLASAAGANICVPDAHRAVVSDIGLGANGKLVKTGGGTLEISSISPSTAEIEVRGGAVSFSQPRINSTPSVPASDPLYWFDGAKGSSFVVEEVVDGVRYISAWKDCREDSTVVGTGVKLTDTLPMVVEDAYDGKSAVSFGTGANRSYLTFPNWDDYASGYERSASRTGFIVVRMNGTGSAYDDAAFFSSGPSSMDFKRRGNGLLNHYYARAKTSSANWSINGVPVDPFAARNELKSTTDFVVVSFDSDHPQYVQGLACDRPGQTSTAQPGWITVAEVILYNRRLSPMERIETEAYLMNRWQGRRHPAMDVASPKVTYNLDGDEALVIDNTDDVVIGEVSGGNGSVVKRGEGTARLSVSTNDSPKAEIIVEAGTLISEFKDAFVDMAVGHYDASALGRISFYTTENGARTNVTAITGNGYLCGFTVTSRSQNEYTITNPTLQTVEMREGVVRPVLDFGYMNNVAYLYRTDMSRQSASMHLNNNDYSKTPIREMHVIIADKVQEQSPLYQDIFTQALTRRYERNGKKLLKENSNTVAARNGYLAVDGEEVAYDSELPSGFHLVSAAPNGAVIEGPTLMRRYQGIGGMQIGELVLYTNENTSVARGFIQKKLMNKWFDYAEPLWPYNVAEGAVAAGATWRDVGNAAFEFERFELLGSVDVKSLKVTDTLVLPISDTAFVSGELDLSELKTIELAGRARARAGETLILSGASIVGLDVSSVELVLPPSAKAEYEYQLVMRSDGIYLRVLPPGMMLIVR